MRIRFPVGDPHSALLIPEEALATDQGQRFVYVIGDNNRVSYRRVAAGMLLAGRRVITEGLAPTDRVAVTGLQRLRKDLEVDPRPQHSESTADTTVPTVTEAKGPSSGPRAASAGAH